MAENKELKITSFRIGDDTKTKISEIAKEIGSKNQDETMLALIRAFELEKARVVIPSREEEIASFKDCAARMIQLYLGLLDDSRHMRDRVKADYDTELSRKDAMIREMQRQSEDMRIKRAEEADTVSKIRENYQDIERKYMALSQESSLKIAELENRNKELVSENSTLKERADEQEKAFRNALETKNNLEVLRQKYAELEFRYENEKRRMELDCREAVLKEREKIQEELKSVLLASRT